MENISIILHIPGQQPLRVIVNSHETSQVLEQYLEGERPHTFFYKDIPICPAFTFKWFGITDGTDIYAGLSPSESSINDDNNYQRSNSSHLSPIAPPIKNGKKAKRKQVKKSLESTNRIPSLSDINQENARIKDQFFRKVEGTVVCYRKIMKRFTHMSANEPVRQHNQIPTIMPNLSPSQPSTNELPKIWNDDDGNINYSTIQSPISPP
ncbi:hypothetical protein M9Y10_005544 [Tritrichomonas musculus]|uniref:Uncharacterized protein n=1 Tax=Tritrichomonas musculus TaxID=1915356 RepID=A0ABR2JCB3_9EUKA